MDRVIREAVEIELHPSNVDSEDDFYLNKSGKPLVCSLRDHGRPPSQDSRDGISTGPRRPGQIALSGYPSALSRCFLSRLPIRCILRSFIPICLSIPKYTTTRLLCLSHTHMISPSCSHVGRRNSSNCYAEWPQKKTCFNRGYQRSQPES
jgi:hypothetical protein